MLQHETEQTWNTVRCIFIMIVERNNLREVLTDAFLFFFLPHHVACGILAPQPGTEPRPLAVRAQSINHWSAREYLT